MGLDLKILSFLDVVKLGTTLDIHAEGVAYVTSTEILDCDPDGEGGIVLTLDATVAEGQLVLTEEMVAAADHDGDCWYVDHGGLMFRFGLAEREPAFGLYGFFTQHPEAREEHGRAVRERETRREAKRLEQEGR